MVTSERLVQPANADDEITAAFTLTVFNAEQPSKAEEPIFILGATNVTKVRFLQSLNAPMPSDCEDMGSVSVENVLPWNV